MKNKEFLVEISILKRKLEYLETVSSQQQEALNKIASKEETKWNPINVILTTLFVSLPLAMGLLWWLYSDTRTQLDELNDITETTSLLIDAQAEFQQNTQFFQQGRFELVEKSTKQLINNIENSLIDVKSPTLKQNLEKLLISAYSFNAVANYNIDSIAKSDEVIYAANKMIKVKPDHWKGYQLLALGQSAQGEDYKLVAENYRKSIEFSKGGYNPNGINLPEWYFINDDYDSCTKWAERFEIVQYEKDITKFRDRDGQVAHYFLVNVSKYIVSGKEEYIDTFKTKIRSIKEGRTGGYRWGEIKSWVKKLRENHVKNALMTPIKRENILLLFDDNNNIRKELFEKPK